MIYFTSLVKQQQRITQNFERSFERKFKRVLTRVSWYDIIYFADKTGKQLLVSTKSEGMQPTWCKPYRIKLSIEL